MDYYKVVNDDTGFKISGNNIERNRGQVALSLFLSQLVRLSSSFQSPSSRAKSAVSLTTYAIKDVDKRGGSKGGIEGFTTICMQSRIPPRNRSPMAIMSIPI